MKLRSASTRISILLAALLALALNGDDQAFYFSMSTGKIFSPGEQVNVDFSGEPPAGAVLSMRVYRINDPVEFLMAQKNPHSIQFSPSFKPNAFEMVESGVAKAKRDARYAAQATMPAGVRRVLRDVTDLNATKSAGGAKSVPARGTPAVRKKTKPGAPQPQPRREDMPAPKGAEKYQLVAKWDYQPVHTDRWSYQPVKVPVKEKGVYVVEGQAHGRRALTVVIVSDYTMIFKQSETQGLAFIVDRKSGERVKDFPVTLSRNTKPLTQSVTGSDGVCRVTIPAVPRDTASAGGDEEEDWYWYRIRNQIMVMGQKDGNFVISEPYYYNGYDDNGSGQHYKTYIHTDRPVYRPAQTMYYRGIMRTVLEDGTYRPVTTGRVNITVTDSRDGIVKRDTVALSDMGTFSGQALLGDEPPLGTYTIEASIDGAKHYENFQVEEYKKPEYKVEVALDKKQYTRGDTLHASVKAMYFFGSPVANAKVEYFIYRSRYWRPWWRGSQWEYLYEEGESDFYTYRSEMVNSGKGDINPDGTFSITYATAAKDDDDYVYRVQAEVVDNSRRAISGSKSAEVTRGEFYISSRTDKYVYRTNEEAKIGLTIATFDGDKPVATSVRAALVRHWWERVRKAGSTDTTSESQFEYKEHQETLWSGSGATGADGKGAITMRTPSKTGFYYLSLEATDSRGTKITESDYVYVTDETTYASWYRQGAGDVQIIPDKASYSPGETMQALVIMPAAKIDALITAEGATLYNYSVERLSSNSMIVRMPIQENYAPTFYLGASAVVNNEMYSEEKRITVVPKNKSLRLEVKANKDVFRPGEKGTVTVRAYDEDNHPVSNVDVAVGVVDEAIYSIEPEHAANIQRYFYGPRYNSVNTTSGLTFDFYGDSRPGTADRYGDGFTQAAGAAGNPNSDYRRSISYGDVKGEMFVQPVVRKNFKDMMFWTPSARTDAEGKAVLNVDFPDNLTTWRITARGVTLTTAVGQTVARVTARKELMVRMETPRFMIQGDELLVATNVHNYLSGAKKVKVQFEGQNITLADRERTITVPANGEERVDWKVSATAVGGATLTVKALTDEESDAMELTVPVLPRGLKSGVGTVAELDENTSQKSVTLALPRDADPATGQLYVNISPSLASSILTAMDDLVGYPYGCVEQTMSRFLPTVIVADALQKINALPFDEKKKAEIPRMVTRGLNKLYTMQHSDGGWGWWEHDKTDAFMTAYVMYGLTVAKRAGFAVMEDKYDDGLGALRKGVAEGKDQEGKPMDATTRAYQLYVLSFVLDGKQDKLVGDGVAALVRTDTINTYSRALLALASKLQRDNQQAMQLASRIETDATVTGTTAHWKGRSWHYNWQDDEVETSAIALKTLLDLRGETELVKKGIRWILTQKNGDSWDNTRQTAMVIYSLVDYLKSSSELNPEYTYTVEVNGREVKSGRMTRADALKPEQRIKIEGATLRTGENTVVIKKSGSGRIYGTARLVYYATGAAIRPASAGFTVIREYYVLRREKKGNVFVYNKAPFTGTVRSGDELLVKVSMTPDARYEYVMLEDPLLAGCEVVRNTAGYTIPGEPEYDESARARSYYSWYWWYADRDIRDAKVSFFARTVSPMSYQFTYILRAQIPGSYSVMPSLASLMYYEEVRGNGASVSMTIKP